jgi:hypothetical protein
MYKWLCCLYLWFTVPCFANDSLLIPNLLQRIIDKQQLETNFFVEGSFKSYRQYNLSENLQPDNNIFFTALIAYTLQQLQAYLTNNEKIVVDTIISRAKTAFSFYKNKKRDTYNFWRTDVADNFFPNDDVLPLFKSKLKLPDDLDDTSIILACLNSEDTSSKKAKAFMQQFANKQYNTVKNTFDEYKNVDAYSTWYGIKMPVDFDFGVHCNILCFTHKYNLSYNKNDSATLQLLLDMIDKNYHLTHAQYISPYYSTTPILLYHIARLMQSKKIEELEIRKEKIVNDIVQAFKQVENEMEKIMLQTCLLKLKSNVQLIDYNIGNIDNFYTTDFTYYTGFLFAHLNNHIKKIANNTSALQFKWYSSAYNDCLLLEYLILKYRKNNYGNSN